MSARVGALILAAGFSNRYGSIKLLAQLENGSNVFRQTLENLRTAVSNILVITRPELESELAPFCNELCIFDEAEKGMGATLAFGTQQIPDWDAALICLADMPFIRSDSYRQIASAASRGNIVLPRYQGKPGNPVAFGADFFPELATLSGDAGGRDVMRAHGDRRVFLDIDDPALLQDIDTPADLARLQRQ